MNFICSENSTTFKKYKQHREETYFLVLFYNPAVETILYLCLSLLGFGLLDTNKPLLPTQSTTTQSFS